MRQLWRLPRKAALVGVVTVMAAITFYRLAVLPTGGGQPSASGEAPAAPAVEATDKAANAPAPLLSLAVNDAARVETFRGWPLLFLVRLMNPAAMGTGAATPMVLTRRGASWADGIRLAVTNVRGESVSWPFVLASRPSGTLSLDGQTVGELVWCLVPQETARLGAGMYEVTANLDAHTTEATQSAAVTVRLSDEPPSLSPEQEAEKHRRFTEYHLVRGDAESAIAEVEQLLGKQPKNLWALQTKGDWHAAAGRITEALSFYDEAVAGFYAQHSQRPHHPRDLLARRHAMLTRLMRE